MPRIFAAFARALNTHAPNEKVHFHAGPAGPFVCENPHCVSPGLDTR